MNKAQLIEVVAKESGLKKKEAEAAVNAFMEAVSVALEDGDKVQLIGFGTFEVKDKPAREGHNPATGEKITIPASKNVGFAASKALKDKVNA